MGMKVLKETFVWFMFCRHDIHHFIQEKGVLFVCRSVIKFAIYIANQVHLNFQFKCNKTPKTLKNAFNCLLKKHKALIGEFLSYLLWFVSNYVFQIIMIKRR